MEIKFLFMDTDLADISGFELGNILIIKDGMQCTSLNRHPDQSMMLFITISDLLNKIYKMFKSREREILIAGVDSSYYFKIKKRKKKYTISDDYCTLTEIEEKELLESIYYEAQYIWDKYGKYICSDSVRYDFCEALKIYEELLTI